MKIGGRKPKLTDEQRQELRQWGRIGSSKKGAAAYFGVSPSTITRYLNGMHKRRRP